MKPLRVLVTGGGALLGQGIIRSLRRGRFSPHIIALDVSPLAAGLYWADEAALIPPANSPDFLSAFERVLARFHPDIVLVGTDVELTSLSEHRADLEARFQTAILVSDPDVVSIADDKYLTASFMREHGFPAPLSALATDRSAVMTLVERLGYPLVAKPCVGARSVGVSVVQSHAELEAILRQPEGEVIQECVGDSRNEFTASGLYFDGRCDAVVVMRRDLRDGNTYRAYLDADESLRNWVVRWTEALKPYGPANFQFRLDSDGLPKVFEINGRFSGTTPLRALVGFNEVDLCIGRVIFGVPVKQPSLRPQVILRHWSETVIGPERIESVGSI